MLTIILTSDIILLNPEVVSGTLHRDKVKEMMGNMIERVICLVLTATLALMTLTAASKTISKAREVENMYNSMYEIIDTIK